MKTKLNSLIKVAMVATGIAACAAQARAVNVSYVDVDGTTKQADATVVAASGTRVTWNAGWYVVTNDVTITGGAYCSGAVHLILADTGKLTISGVANNKAGIGVTGNPKTLAIYGQTLGTGALKVTGGVSGAGIGGGKLAAGSNITINGGTVTAQGGISGAGIGGGNGDAGSDITINGGTVTAQGGSSGAGIGGGNGGAGSNIWINAGTVKATGSKGGAGIGNGKDCNAASRIYAADAVVVKAGNVPFKSSTEVSTIAPIDHTGTQDIASLLADKRYAMAAFVTCTREEVTGPRVLEEGKTYTAVPATKHGGAFYVSAGATLTGTNVGFAVNTVQNEGKDKYHGGAIYVDENGAVNLSDATFIGNTAVDIGGAIYVKDGATLACTNVTFEGCVSGSNGGAICLFGLGALKDTVFRNNKANSGAAVRNQSTGVLSLDGVTFEGNEALSGDAVNNRGTVNIAGRVELKTASDYWCNKERTTVNWDLTGGPGHYGTLVNFQQFTNVNASTTQKILITGDQPAGDYVIATGDFSNIKKASTENFSITNVLGGAALRTTINGGVVEFGGEKFALLVQDNGTPGIATDDLLVLQVGPSTIVPTEVTGATAKVYTNGNVEVAAPYAVDRGAVVDVVYTADAGKMFPGGYKTFETNLTANAAAITVAVPAGQEPVAATTCEDCLTFSADAAFGIRFVTSSETKRNLEYSTDRTYWVALPPGKSSEYAAALAGEEYKIYFRGLNNTGLSRLDQKIFRCFFTNTVDSVATAIACSGNIETLLDYREVAKGNHPKMDDYAFAQLFYYWKALTTAPELPAENLATKCYNKMFQETSLTDIPELNVALLTNACCAYMFAECPNLIVNATGPGKPWKIPSDVQISDDAKFNGKSYWATSMFRGTAGTVTNGVEIVPGTTYYVASAPVTVVVPEVAGATAQLYAFDVNGGWRAVATNRVPFNATVRVVWTADEGKGLWTNGVESAYQWQTAFGPVVGGEIAPAPAVREAGESVVTVDLDTRTDKRYFRAEDILPVWAAQGAEVKVKGEGEQSWTDLVKNMSATNTFSWKPTEQGVYTLSHPEFENATIILATPVEVTTNGLEVAGTTVQVTVDGTPVVAQTEGEFAGKIIVPSNSTVKAVWTATGAGVYFMDGTTTYAQEFKADKDVNAVSEVVTVPDAPAKPSVKVGVVAQRYPWDGKLDVQYWAKNTPNGEYTLKVTVTVGGEAKDQEVKALNGKNAMVFDMREAFGEVTATGVKVKAELVKSEE